MLEQQRRYRVESWLDLRRPQKLKKRRTKALAKEKTKKPPMLRKTMIEIIVRHFGEYRGQTSQVHEKICDIARSLQLGWSTVKQVVKRYL